MTLIFALFIYRIFFLNIRIKQVLDMTNCVVAFCLTSAEFKINLVTLHTVARWHFSCWSLTAFFGMKISTFQHLDNPSYSVLQVAHSTLLLERYCKKIEFILFSRVDAISLGLNALLYQWHSWIITFICRSRNPHMVVRFILLSLLFKIAFYCIILF